MNDLFEGLEIKERKIAEELDPHIRPLVMGLRSWGLETFCSCEGHKEKHKDDFPSVEIDLDPEDMLGIQELLPDEFLLRKIIERWNQISKVKWCVSPYSGSIYRRIWPKKTDLPLSILQKNAEEFGLWLLNASKALQKEIREAADREVTNTWSNILIL